MLLLNHYVNLTMEIRMNKHSPMNPNECQNMDDIRREIDAMDNEIISILGQRFEYVKAAAKFKTSATTVRAPERFEAMLKQRRVWAQQQGLSPDAIEKMYRDLVNHFISEEMTHWQESQK